jgi:hypothetical protein
MLEEKLGASKCENRNLEMQWKNIKKCVLETMSDLVGEVNRKARKLWTVQEMINKIDG